MNTNELISMVTKRRKTLEENLIDLSGKYFQSFKEKLTQTFEIEPFASYAKKIGLTISRLSKDDFTVSSFIYLYDNESYEKECLTPLDDFSDLLFDLYAKNDLAIFLNCLKNYGFKLFVDKNKNLIPFIEID